MTLSIIFLVIAALAKAFQDHAMRNAYPEEWIWWNLKTGSKNKWKGKTKLKRLLMSTVFVWVTDAWHFFQFIYLNLLMVGFWLLPFDWSEWYWVLAFIVGFKVAFQGFYSLLKLIFK